MPIGNLLQKSHQGLVRITLFHLYPASIIFIRQKPFSIIPLIFICNRLMCDQLCSTEAENLSKVFIIYIAIYIYIYIYYIYKDT